MKNSANRFASNSKRRRFHDEPSPVLAKYPKRRHYNSLVNDDDYPLRRQRRPSVFDRLGYAADYASFDDKNPTFISPDEELTATYNVTEEEDNYPLGFATLDYNNDVAIEDDQKDSSLGSVPPLEYDDFSAEADNFNSFDHDEEEEEQTEPANSSPTLVSDDLGVEEDQEDCISVAESCCLDNSEASNCISNYNNHDVYEPLDNNDDDDQYYYHDSSNGKYDEHYDYDVEVAIEPRSRPRSSLHGDSYQPDQYVVDLEICVSGSGQFQVDIEII